MYAHELAQRIGRKLGLFPPIAPRGAEAVRLQCMEVWGGNAGVDTAIEVAGIETWIHSEPYKGERHGGDIHYVSTCASGRVSRFVVADVAGHGNTVGELAASLRLLMRKHVNLLNMSRFARELNNEFSRKERAGRFATAVLVTYFAPSDNLIICNAGHPRPLWYSAAKKTWQFLDNETPENVDDVPGAFNLPLGVIEETDYQQFAVKLAHDDLVILYTDSLTESMGAETKKYLGEEGLLRLIRTLSPGSSKEVSAGLLSAVAAYRGGEPAGDDVTVVVLRHNAQEPPGMTRGWAGVTAIASALGIIDY
jgi:sigma-B regulation protein RsbU (phosphoserine phosphatase)